MKVKIESIKNNVKKQKNVYRSNQKTNSEQTDKTKSEVTTIGAKSI